ncbi:DNA repair protein [Aureibaculum algae]|uniref:DNA repair protein n=1 Tax=Aureibaculum algae TaxID=2584122 RepID=A0A5B7TY58_9FLAO|nr:JAB domain-containing protein [Aureibaculum algae]QCX40284.1 DNA repair protein [Aureibaculum algae]
MKNKVNEIKISYKSKETKTPCKINRSADAANLLFEHWNQDTIELHESFKVVLMNNSNIVKGIIEISNGGIAGTLVDVRILFAVALKTLTTGIIICHNHPSGTLKPSEADKRLTTKIKQASEFLDIKLLDHLILIFDGAFYSFADNNLL